MQHLPKFKPSVLGKTRLLLVCLFLPFFLLSQNADPSLPNAAGPNTLDYITVAKIYIEGHKRTKTDIILRELDFKIGDTIHLDHLSQRLRENELNIMNTGLFTAARMNFKEWEGATNKVGLNIEVKEDWYVFPFPIVELADRNFNVWWRDFGHSLKRLNLGVRFYHTNFSGRRDWLKAVLQFGFTQKYELIYTLPSFNKKQTVGLNFNLLHTREKEIGYTTFENKLQFQRNDNEVLFKRFRIGAGLSYRPKLDQFHELNLTYRSHQIHESVRQELNPDFFLNGLRQRYFSINYQYSVDKRDIRPYPMNGFFISGNITKNGLGLNGDIQSLDVSAAIQQYFSIGKKWSIALAAKGKTGLQRGQQPYYTSRALGYFDDYIRGYEFYVIDGLDFVYHKQALRFKIFDKKYFWGKYMKLESFKTMPVKAFLVAHNELGYVNNPFYKKNNPLSNEALWGAGLGLDVVIYYNKVINLEYSRNHLGEQGFFLHWSFSF